MKSVPKSVPATRAAAPVALVDDDAARLRRLIEFAQWERVAMVRFGLASAAWATAGYEPTPISLQRAKPGDTGELRRDWERAQALVRDNHEKLEKALGELSSSLDLSDGDWI